MSGFDEYVKTGLIKSEKKESAFEVWYKENEADVEEEYQEYVKDTEHLGDKPMTKKEWAKEIFESQTVEEETVKASTIYKEKIKAGMSPKKAAEEVLDIISGGMFVAAEEPKRSQMIDAFVKKHGTKSESVSPVSFIDKVLSEKKEKFEIKKYPELDEIAKRIAKETAVEINKSVKDVKSEMPYRAQYVLEGVIEILEAKV